MIDEVKKMIKDVFKGDASGHDYWHSIRVYNTAMQIAEQEGGDKNIISLASLLHDVDDVKLFHTLGYKNARRIMTEVGVEEQLQDTIIDIIKSVSFRGTGSKVPSSLEGKIVQDADRLDALGAIGIARTFAFGGNNNQEIHNPLIAPTVIKNSKEYYAHKSTSVNHFYEKLFLLKDMMNTETAKEIAEDRDQFMHMYMDKFMNEWEGV